MSAVITLCEWGTHEESGSLLWRSSDRLTGTTPEWQLHQLPIVSACALPVQDNWCTWGQQFHMLVQWHLRCWHCNRTPSPHQSITHAHTHTSPDISLIRPCSLYPSPKDQQAKSLVTTAEHSTSVSMCNTGYMYGLGWWGIHTEKRPDEADNVLCKVQKNKMLKSFLFLSIPSCWSANTKQVLKLPYRLSNFVKLHMCDM
jgi:hypothetical protein